jgi:ABC-type phosphate transport system substrate-binding protein
MIRTPLGAATLALLTACGGGGSDSPAAPPAATEVAQTARMRASDGFDIQVTPYRMSNAASAEPTRVEVRIADTSQVASLTAAVGKDFEGATPLAASATGAGVWSLAWPAGLAADSGLLLTVTLKNEDVFETGLTDFQLNR